MSADITIRPANLSDMSDIWEWRNDWLTRQMFRDGSKVSPEDNEKWFKSAMKDDRRNIFISQSGENKVCMIRFDEFEPGRFDVSINMNPAWRGKRLSKQVLADSIEFLATFKRVDLITAEVKDINIASKKIFAANGFGFVRRDGEYCVYEKTMVDLP